MEAAGSALQGVGQLATKTATIATVGATAGAIVAGSGSVAATAGAGAAVAVVANETIKENQDQERIPVAQREDVSGGIPYEQIINEPRTTENHNTIANLASAENESNDIAHRRLELKEEYEADLDPYEAFRKCMANAGLSNATSIQADTSCLPQKQSRKNRSSEFSRSLS